MPKSVRLHARDVEVLNLLASRQIETLDFFHQRLWADCNRKSAYNRLRALANAGYLEHVKRTDPTAPKAWQGPRPALEHLFTLGPRAPTALRIRAREAVLLARRHRRGGIPAALIDHQLATNRAADALGVRLLTEAEASAGLERGQKNRPDGAYRVPLDRAGRDLVLVEIDLGHYSRDRILEKTRIHFDHKQSKALLFVCPTPERGDRVRSWIDNRLDPTLHHAFMVLTFDELREPHTLPLEYRPIIDSATDADTLGWWRAVMGPPGCQ